MRLSSVNVYMLHVTDSWYLYKIAISKARSMVEDSVLNLYGSSFPESLSIVDLGCSSGPNTLLVIKEIIDVTHERCSHLQRSMPEKRRPSLLEHVSLQGCPVSFYGRLFPIYFLDFVHSSYSVHWLSQVPQGLQSDMGLPLSKGNIYMAKSSPPAVCKAYLDQFQSDFSLFLKLRSEEMTCEGRMVLTLMGRKGEEPSRGDCCHLWELLAQALKGMVSQGVIEEGKLDSFDLPYYTPSVKELKAVIAMEGSFILDRLQITEINWDTNDNDDSEGYVFDKKASGQNVVKCIRVVTESLLANHFGAEIIDELFEKYVENVGEHLAKEKTKHVNFIFSMTKKV
ncbi:hypothetical protein AAC387_Pa08g1458 [Persea americana]